MICDLSMVPVSNKVLECTLDLVINRNWNIPEAILMYFMDPASSKVELNHHCLYTMKLDSSY